ncbi:MAG TPA: hypothetical protein VME70_05630 [Mycobacteriales bacterium]|nr:hypothetical protein [Mycobacteriales bacterium]
MYGWVWRRLPGSRPVKLVASLVLLVAVLALLFLVVFPWLGPRLPFDHNTVGGAIRPLRVASPVDPHARELRFGTFRRVSS